MGHHTSPPPHTPLTCTPPLPFTHPSHAHLPSPSHAHLPSPSHTPHMHTSLTHPSHAHLPHTPLTCTPPLPLPLPLTHPSHAHLPSPSLPQCTILRRVLWGMSVDKTATDTTPPPHASLTADVAFCQSTLLDARLLTQSPPCTDTPQFLITQVCLTFSKCALYSICYTYYWVNACTLIGLHSLKLTGITTVLIIIPCQ